jgi:hypothetical protein
VDRAPEQVEISGGAGADPPGRFQRPKPRKDGSNTVQAALASGGLVIPPHSSEIGSPTEAWLIVVAVSDYYHGGLSGCLEERRKRTVQAVSQILCEGTPAI